MSFIGRSQSNHDKGISSPWILVAGGFASATMSLMIYKFNKHYIEQKKFYYIPERPSLIEEAKANDKPIYYFGVGSNMVRSFVLLIVSFMKYFLINYGCYFLIISATF